MGRGPIWWRDLGIAFLGIVAREPRRVGALLPRLLGRDVLIQRFRGIDGCERWGSSKWRFGGFDTVRGTVAIQIFLESIESDGKLN